MKTIAIFKWAMNPHDERVSADGSIKWNAKRPEVGDDDHVVVQVAAEVANGGEVVGLTSASGDTAFAAARGAETTCTYADLPVTAQPLQIAQALATAVKEIGDFDAVVIGDSAWQPAVPGLLAGLLGVPAILAVDDAKPDGDGLLVTRRFGPGTQDVKVSGPVLLAVMARHEEESKPGMRAVLQARKKPVSDLALDGFDAEAVPTLDLKETREPDTVASKIFDGSDPEAAAKQLVQALQAEGVL